MPDINLIRQIILSFPETREEPHFEKTSFRVRKKILATFDGGKNQTCVKLSEKDQDLFSLHDKSIIFPVPNKWGKQGWTFIDMRKVSVTVFEDVLKAAYCNVAPKNLASTLL